MITKKSFRIFWKYVVTVFTIAQFCYGFEPKAFADNNTASLEQQVQSQLPISAAAYTNAARSDDKWTPIERYLANLKPTDDYTATVEQAVYQTAYNDTYVDTYPQSVTDLETTIMGWTSAGNDATNVNGVNLVEKLYQQSPDQVGSDGDNAVIFDLIALDSKPYRNFSNTTTIRQQLVQEILDSKLPSGGWGYLTFNNGQWGSAIYDSNWNVVGYNAPTDQDFDTDITGMAITALAPYYQSDPRVKQAVDQAVVLLQQKGNISNCSSLAQMIVGLSSVQVDPTSFNNTNLVQKLLAFETPNGLFKYNASSTSGDTISTKDAIAAMAAYLKFENNSGSYGSIYYQMHGPGTLADPVIPQQPTGTSGGTTAQTNGKVTVSVVGYQGQTLLSATPIDLQANDNPYTVLIRAIGNNQVISTGSGTSIYVESIDGLSQFAKGPLSGWMYTVNGQFTNIGAGSYPLKGGDSVQWIYTTNGGKDVGAPDSGGATASSAGPSSTVTDAIQSISLPVDNTKPIDQVGQTVVVQNANQLMTAEQAQALAQALANNQVNLSQEVSPDQDQVLSDSLQEVQLYVPKNAVTIQKTISIQKEPAPRDHKELLSSIYDFGPNGTHFDKPIDITIKVPLTIKDLNQVALVWLNESTDQWVPVPAVVNAQTGEVTGEVNHFTKFAVIDRSQLHSQSTINSDTVNQAIQSACQKILASSPISDWSSFALARAEQTVPLSYLASVKALLEQNHGTFHNVTDYERLVFGILGAGGDPLNIDGYNLIEKIYDNSRLTSQGTNGVIFALLALNSDLYQVPDNATWNQDKLVDWLLKNQNSDGGWALVAGDQSDLDLTSMAIASLAPYQNRDDVKKATDAAVQWIIKSNSQTVNNSESIAQEIQGLTALGINPIDGKFNRDGKDLIADLLQFQQKDGGFAHQPGQSSDPMATEQALAALDSFIFYEKGQGSIYQFSKQENAEYIDTDQISPWALDSVNKAKQYNIMQGVSGSVPVFAPKQQITRAEFTKVIVSLLGEKPATGSDSIFDDVQPGTWYYGYVKTAKDLGIINGISATTFTPDQPITREQMAVIIANAWHLKPISSALNVADHDQIDGYALPAVHALYDHGIMVGDGTIIDPHGQATREMVAVLAIKLYESK